MAGVLWNGQVWAILERDDGSYVVKPGDSVGDAKVRAIGRSEMVVADASGKQDVQLRGLALAASAVQPAAAAPQYGRPGLPAWQQTYGVAPQTGVQQPAPAATGRVRERRGRRYADQDQ